MTTANRQPRPRTDSPPDGGGLASARRAASRRASRDGPVRRLGGLLLALVLFFPGLSAAAAPDTVRIGILAHRGEAAAVAAYQPTADFLSERVPGPRFSVVPYDLREMELAIAMGAVDFVITNPEQYVVLEARHHVTRIATLVRETGGRHVRQFGGVIFTRADRADLGAIGDIRGKRVAAVGPTAFGGFLMQAQVLREAGIDVSKDASMDFLGLPQDRIVQAVLDGRADVGFVRSDLLEQMAGEGRLSLDRLRVLNPRQVPDYPFRLATPLYPEWPIAAADRTPLELSNRVAVALLSMPPGHPAARQGGYHAWTVPLSYRSVHDLMRAMRVAPYDRPEDFHLADVVRKYDFHLMALLTVAGMVAAAIAWRFRRMNRALGVQIGLVGERTTALESEVARRRLAERHLERETHALEMMARNAGLPDVMHVLCLLCEDGSRGGHAIIMESAEDGHVLRLAAAPSLSADCRRRLAELVPPGDGPAAWREAVAAACGDALVPRLVVPIDLQGGRHGGVLVLLMPADAALADGADDAVRDAATLAGLALDARRAAEQVRLSASVFDNALEGIVITDADSRIVQVNQAFVRATGFAPQEVIGRRPSLLRSGRHDRPFYAAMWDALVHDGSWRGEIWNKRRNGEIYPQILHISAIRDDRGRSSHYIGIYADITDLKATQQKLERLANFDALTGLPNRTLLTDRLRQAMAQARRRRRLLAVCFLDLDAFKPINDSHGHAVGDRILAEVGRRLQGAVRAGDTVARFGGDEFVILLGDLADEAELSAGLGRVLELVAEPYPVDDLELHLSASIGVALFPADPADPDMLLRQADQAMYEAKREGRNRYRVFRDAAPAR